MECLLGILDLLQSRYDGSIERCEVNDSGVSLRNCTIFYGCLTYEDFVLSCEVFSLLLGSRVNVVLYG